MFDNKKEPQDIFEGVEPPANLPVGGSQTASVSTAAGAPQPPRPTPPLSQGGGQRPFVAPPSPVGHQPTNVGIVNDRHLGTGGHLWKTILIVLVAFAVLGLAAFLAYKFTRPADDSEVETADGNLQTNDTQNQGQDDGEETEVITPPVVDDSQIDTDGDGLTNDKEIAAGTNINSPDTDQDALGDKEELDVYGTDPLNPDSDADTFKDGQEVRAGYNPKGPGKLLEIPSGNP